jgi:hypothetical protein
MSTEASSGQETDELTDQLDEPFTIEASGPVEYRRLGRDAEDVVEVLEIDVEIDREIETIEEFERFYELRESGRFLADAIEILVEDCDDYTVVDVDEWSFEIDGPVGAYDAAARSQNENDTGTYWRKRIAKECAKCPLFGDGATIALLAAQRDSAASADLGQTVEQYAGDNR